MGVAVRLAVAGRAGTVGGVGEAAVERRGMVRAAAEATEAARAAELLQKTRTLDRCQRTYSSLALAPHT